MPYERALAIYAEIARSPHLAARGVDMHIGSQITDLDPFDNAFALLAELVISLRANGHSIEHVDVGGGLGIPYRHDNDPPPDPRSYAAIVKNRVQNLDCRLIVEPGRLIAGNAGILVSRVEYLKLGQDRSFVITDAGMNDLIRPTLYEAYHEILPVEEAKSRATPIQADVVGPVCESGDYFAQNRRLPELAAGDLIAVMSAGAYGAVMSSTYNSRPLVAEVLVDGDRFHTVRPRQSLDQLIELDSVPDWIPSV